MILVSGGTGLLGSNLLYALTASGKKCRAIFRDQSKIQLTKKVFESYDRDRAEELFSNIEWLACDVLDVFTLNEVMQGCEIVYHCAALVSFRRRDFSSMMKINRSGTANMVNVALACGVKKFCYVSSTAAVGKEKGSEFDTVVETNKWTQSPKTSGYSISKYSAEKEVWRAMEEGLNAVIINPSVIFGPGSWNESSLTIFRTISQGMKFYTSGSNAFVDVRDVVKCMIKLTDSNIQGERFLCTGTNIAFKDLFDLMAAELKVKAPSIHAGAFLCGIAWRLASLLALFKGKATITKESAKSAQSFVRYDSSKLLKTLSIEFTPIKDTIAFTVKGRINP